MDVLDLSRWQFGITTAYRFFLRPHHIGTRVVRDRVPNNFMRIRSGKVLEIDQVFPEVIPPGPTQKYTWISRPQGKLNVIFGTQLKA